jgi:serine phosphatase RsbU (regulator of sigma subunit)
MINYATPFSIGLTIITGILFNIRYLNLSFYHPRLYRYMRYLLFFSIAGFVAGNFIPYAFLIRIVAVNSILVCSMMMAVALYSYTKGYKPAKYYLLAWTIFLLGTAIFAMRNLGIFPSGFIVESILEIGSVFVLLILSIAIASQYKNMLKEKNIAQLEAIQWQKKHNEKLEQQVQERTRELTDKQAEIDLDIHHASIVQQTILSSGKILDNNPFYGIEIQYLPMNGKISGDYYHFHLVDEEKLFVFLGDATGHGIQAAFSTMQIDILNKESLEWEFPDIKLNWLNQELIRLNTHNFFSCFSAVIHKHVLQYTTAGHPTQYILRKKHKELIPLKTKGKIVGMMPESKYELKQLDLEKDDILLLFTDGIFEQFNEKNIEWGDTEFEKMLVKSLTFITHHNLSEIAEYILGKLALHIGGSALNDDITLICIKIL